MRARQVDGAGGDAECLVNKMDDPVREAVREIRAKINGTVLHQAARDIHAWEFFKRGKPDVRVGLIVTEQHVKFWLMLLDEVVFERQGFPVVIHDDVVEIGNFSHQGTGLGVRPPGFEEIRSYPVPQRTRLADVENISQGVLE